jgi:Protein of unknown function (DUF3551)
MKVSLIVVTVFATIALSSVAMAQNYPWCAYIDGEGGGGRNCGFVSFGQCLATARGLGADCRPNTQFTPPVGPHPFQEYPE